MKHLFSYLGTIVVIAIQSFVFSAVLWGIQWLLSLLSICSTPGVDKFLYGALGIFLFLFIYSVITTGITMYRFQKDPAFKEANMRMGLSWRQYKRLKDEQ